MFVATTLLAGILGGVMFAIFICIICAGIVTIIDEDDMETIDFLCDVMKVAAGAGALAIGLYILYALIYAAILIFTAL